VLNDYSGTIFAVLGGASTGEKVRRVEVFRWKFYDAMLRMERLTPVHLTRAEAEQRFPGATPDLTTREVRNDKFSKVASTPSCEAGLTF
jgi:hypothetical protein